jgi:hypothetical protein
MSTSSPPKIESTQEVRFAVVMYGGVSLAIYINGITQELLHMVRSTAEAAKGSQGNWRRWTQQIQNTRACLLSRLLTITRIKND